MTERDLKYLSDIINAIDLIEDFTRSIESYNDYVNDLKTQSAVERQLGIIGKAVNKFESLHPDSKLKHGGKIIGFRNRLIHAYDAIDNSIVWTILINHLKPLKEEVAELIK